MNQAHPLLVVNKKLHDFADAFLEEKESDCDWQIACKDVRIIVRFTALWNLQCMTVSFSQITLQRCINHNLKII